MECVIITVIDKRRMPVNFIKVNIMLMIKKKFTLLLLSAAIPFFLQAESSKTPVLPFADIAKITFDGVTSREGEQTADETEAGVLLHYENREWLGFSGTLTYLFDKDDNTIFIAAGFIIDNEEYAYIDSMLRKHFMPIESRDTFVDIMISRYRNPNEALYESLRSPELFALAPERSYYKAGRWLLSLEKAGSSYTITFKPIFNH
jgi:hypothetical protein